MDERWFPVAGWDGFYEVSDHGRVRSVDRVVVGSDDKVYRRKGIVRALLPDGEYLKVSLRRPGEFKNAKVHILVLSAFVGPCPDGMECCHKDGNSKNNFLVNLRWGTRSSNNFDRVLHGTHNESSKIRCPRVHLLLTPNLVPASLARGSRVCLSCNRAAAYRRRALLRGADVLSLDDLSDRYYRVLLADSPELQLAEELFEAIRYG